MSELTLQQAFDLALEHHQAGRLAEAESIYRQVLAVAPNQPDCLHYLGVIALQVGQYAAAKELIEKALAFRPEWPEALSNLGEVLRAKGETAAAAASFNMAVELAPNFVAALSNLANSLNELGRPEEALVYARRAIAVDPNAGLAWFNLANAHHTLGQNDEALSACQRALQINPQSNIAHNLWGVILLDKGQLREAISAFHTAIALDPKFGFAYSNVGVALLASGQLDDAVAACRRSIELEPRYSQAYYNLGNALSSRGQFGEAIAAYRQALALNPNSTETHCNLGNAYQDQGDLDSALGAFQRAIELDPLFPDAHNNLGNILRSRGEHEAALAAHRQTLVLSRADDEASLLSGPARPAKEQFQTKAVSSFYSKAIPGECKKSIAHSNLLFDLHYSCTDAAAIAAEHRAWAQQHGEPLRSLIQPHTNDRSPERRLRIGYVSPDFHEHAVARLLLPLLANHDRKSFEIFAYAQVFVPDDITERMQGLTDAWRSTVGLSDQQLADQIRRDQIDILVDLAGHTAHNRLLAFAQKPAPVQVTGLGYPDTTGLSTIDYRLTDAFADPVGETESLHSEQLVRIPDSGWCIELTDQLVPRARSAGPITFGCFNNMAKVTEAMLRLWAQILQQVPDSRLLLKSQGMGSAVCRERIQKFMSEFGITASRLDLRLPDKKYGGHLEQYHDMDIALDPFPYHGTVSTCEALWLGVPVVTLEGKSHVSRVGVSLLTNVGLPELVAETPEEYIRIAVELASDLPRLQELRSTLRERMQASPLMDAPKYARNIEAVYRQMWRTWCESLKK